MATAAAGAGDLFVVNGRLASARSTGQGTLEVAVTAATVLWFSDRPARLNGNRPIGQFVAEWPSTFGENPPNAAVLAPSDEHPRRPIAVELGRLVLFVDDGHPLPPPPPSPPQAAGTAFAEGMDAIQTLQSLAASGGSVGAAAVADLEALQQAAARR